MTEGVRDLLRRVTAGHEPTGEEALALAVHDDLPSLMGAATRLRDQSHGKHVSYSRKIFIPLTRLCRDSCHYCTFARPPHGGTANYLSPDEIVAIARAGVQVGCHEALFTLGDKPELRYRAAREELASRGHETTIGYLAAMAKLVREETGLLPHVNPGVMTASDIAALRTVAVSQGIMLETIADRLALKGGPHFGSPDKIAAPRLNTIKLAGEADVPFTSGILIGIGETRSERIEALLAIRDLHRRYGHIQEVIIQNFKPKPGTRMAWATEPSEHDHLWTIAVARIVLGPAMNIQAPPNLAAAALGDMIAAGLNDWGGVSPVTPDYVNPEAQWPEIEALERQTAAVGKILVARLAIYPPYLHKPKKWLDARLHTPVLRAADANGFARSDSWIAGAGSRPPLAAPHSRPKCAQPSDALQRTLDRAANGNALDQADIASLFEARGDDFYRVCVAADRLREQTCGPRVTYVVNRNINYTNVCYFHCKFCAFSKGKPSANLRARPYDLALQEIQRRCEEAWQRGATEVCLQGGIHPDYTGATYLSICRAIKGVTPDMHIHAFSPLEVFQGALTLGLSVAEFLAELKATGLGSLPGTAAEILDDEIRALICPDKITTQQWLDVVATAHRLGLPTTATIMYGHVDGPANWARHLLHIRNLQAVTGGFTEFVPLPFVPMETPIYLHGKARKGPTFREAVLMHAVARIVLHPLVPNIQASWVKLGPDGVKWCLEAGANDLGGSLMNEQITRAAGARHGEEMRPEELEALAKALGRVPVSRTTLYREPPARQHEASFSAAPVRAFLS